jgi:hypothetical protein
MRPSWQYSKRSCQGFPCSTVDIEEMSVAFGITFPSLAHLEVCFWAAVLSDVLQTTFCIASETVLMPQVDLNDVAAPQQHLRLSA